MKNEERIIEILAESLRKQDRQEELLTKLVESHLKQGETLEKHGTLIEKQGVILEKQSGILGKLLEGQERLTTEFHRMNDHLLAKQDKMEDRIVRLENKVFKA
tara:strand:- start:487 stop:795 length:309 start_codon:yes stop_codon:yes gene_type:complete